MVVVAVGWFALGEHGGALLTSGIKTTMADRLNDIGGGDLRGGNRLRPASRLHAECGLGEQMISKVNWKSNSMIMTVGVCVVFHLFISIVSGIMVGYARSDLVGDRSKVPGNVIKSTERTRQWLENETNDAIRFWYPVYHFSQHYPIGWILTPITKKIGRGILKEYMDERNLSSEQVRFRVQAIAVAQTLINSFFFGFSLFLSWTVVHKTRQKNSRK